MNPFEAMEGDFIEARDGLIFDVKGLVHPPDRVVAYVRYIPDPSGERRRGSVVYRKVYSLMERERLLETRYPRYLFYDPVYGRRLQGVPIQDVAAHYKPAEKLLNLSLLDETELDRVEEDAVEFAEVLSDASGVALTGMGLSGSVLVGLQAAESDIDLIVYGRRNSLRVHDALKALLRERSSPVLPYDLRDLEKLYSFRVRDTRVSFEEFVRSERRKVMQGKFAGRDYFIRFVLDSGEARENYGDRTYTSLGRARVEAWVHEDSDSVFTPCSYGVTGVKVVSGSMPHPVEEIASFRGRFCEQALRGERVFAEGSLEEVRGKDGTTYYRLVLGEDPSDFMTVQP